MGGQLGKPNGKIAITNNRKSRSVRSRLQKLRKNRTDPHFATGSQVSLEKCESLIDINDYHQFTSPSYLDLYQRGNSVEVDERPEDWIRGYKDIKNKVHALGVDGGGRTEWREARHELDAFIADLDECGVWELRDTLLEKAQRLGTLLEEKRVDTTTPEVTPPPDDECTDADMRKVRLFEEFVALSCRLDAVRFRMVEYYGDDAQPEYGAIIAELTGIVHDVRAIHDGGELLAIVTREEYEDYAVELRQRFLRLVCGNMRQPKGPKGPKARIRRSNTNVSLAD